jgi:hypothetical protein
MENREGFDARDEVAEHYEDIETHRSRTSRLRQRPTAGRGNHAQQPCGRRALPLRNVSNRRIRDRNLPLRRKPSGSYQTIIDFATPPLGMADKLHPARDSRALGPRLAGGFANGVPKASCRIHPPDQGMRDEYPRRRALVAVIIGFH